jgi:carbonic anhydrase/acetyltransferase-like protein (isoleucine patch superfamily)
MGDGCSVWFNAVVRGDEHYIRIGNETNIQDNCVVHVTPERFPVEIGNRVTVGHGAVLHGCVIEDECMIGMGAVILDGAHIGRGSLVAAGALVKPGFVAPPGSFVAGSPAEVRKALSEEQLKMLLRNRSEYKALVADYVNGAADDAAVHVRGFLR